MQQHKYAGIMRWFVLILCLWMPSWVEADAVSEELAFTIIQQGHEVATGFAGQHQDAPLKFYLYKGAIYACMFWYGLTSEQAGVNCYDNKFSPK